MLALSVAGQGLQPVSRWNGKVGQFERGMQNRKLFECRPMNAGWDAPAFAGSPEQFCVRVAESGNHTSIITRCVMFGPNRRNGSKMTTLPGLRGVAMRTVSLARHAAQHGACNMPSRRSPGALREDFIDTMGTAAFIGTVDAIQGD